MSEAGQGFAPNLGFVGRFCVLVLVTQLCCIRYAHCGLQAVSVNGKPTSQSSTYSGSYTSNKANDGNPSSFAHTNRGDPHPWWRIDLESEHCLGTITVFIRLACCGDRFIGAVVRAGLSPNYAENRPCGSPATPAQSYAGAVIEFLCDTPRMARYVTLDIDTAYPGVTDPFLQIAEIAVAEHTTRRCDVPQLNSATFEILHKNSLIGNPNPLMTKMARSLALCANYCSQLAHCFSFDFGKSSSQCHLYNLNSTDIVVTPSDYFLIYAKLN